MSQSPDNLETRRAHLLGFIANLKDIRPGSILGAVWRCGKPNCHYAQSDDPGHGPNLRLTYKSEISPQLHAEPKKLHSPEELLQCFFGRRACDPLGAVAAEKICPAWVIVHSPQPAGSIRPADLRAAFTRPRPALGPAAVSNSDNPNCSRSRRCRSALRTRSVGYCPIVPFASMRISFQDRPMRPVWPRRAIRHFGGKDLRGDCPPSDRPKEWKRTFPRLIPRLSPQTKHCGFFSAERPRAAPSKGKQAVRLSRFDAGSGPEVAPTHSDRAPPPTAQVPEEEASVAQNCFRISDGLADKHRNEELETANAKSLAPRRGTTCYSVPLRYNVEAHFALPSIEKAGAEGGS